MHWRPTRLVAEDRERLTRATVEETSTGWRWPVYKGTVLVASGGVFLRLSKEAAIQEATLAMSGGKPS